MIFGHEFSHNFNWTFEVEALAWTDIEFVSDSIQLLLAVGRQVSAFRQVLPDQPIDVFVAPALPGAVWVTKIDRHASLSRDLGMPGHLASLVIRHALSSRQRHTIERRTESFDCRGGCRIVHFHQHQIPAAALHQRADGRRIGLAFDQVTFPVTWYHAILNLRRTHVDANHVGYLAAPIHTTRTWTTAALTLPQANDQFLAQFTDRQSIDCVVDRFPADVGVNKAWCIHVPHSAGNLLRRKALSKQVGYPLNQRVPRHPLFPRSAGQPAFSHGLLGIRCTVGSVGITVTPDLSTHRGRAAVEHLGDSSNAHPPGQANLDVGAFFDTQFKVRHGDTIPEWSGVALSSCGRPA